MQSRFLLTHADLNLDQIKKIINGDCQIEIDDQVTKRMGECRHFLERKVKESDAPIYGVNTGFGSLCDTLIDHKDIAKLQHNLVVSHACGAGREVPEEIVRLMLLLKIKGLSLGYSGVTVQLLERLQHYFNHSWLPVVYDTGSLGASGDLAPLAFMSLPLIGEGSVNHKEKQLSAAELHESADLEPLVLNSKEGLALLNGTQFMSAYGVQLLLHAEKLLKTAAMNVATGIDAFCVRTEPFDIAIQNLRPYSGQKKAAKVIRDLLKGSELSALPKSQVQDPYSFRCVPQVHGAVYQVFDHVKMLVETEINSVTDNPLVIPEEDTIVSGGNFHGEPLALAFDYLSTALCELGNISERRSYLLLTGQRDLPTYLIKNAGINSGLMIAQYVAAALVSKNKQLASPASVDSIVSSNGQEDHVSMGANAATQCYEIAQNVERILAIEYMIAAQALDFRRPAKSSDAVEKQHRGFRESVPFLENDRFINPDIDKTQAYLHSLA